MTTDDRDQWRMGERRRRRTDHIPLGRRHIITSPNQPGPVPCYCPISRDHTEHDYYQALGRTT